MKTIAFFSPLNPIRSGISDYSEDLLPYLANMFTVELYVPNGFEVENERIRQGFNIKFYSEFEQNHSAKRYAAILYHMGNNYEAHRGIYEFILRYPGIVILHDYSLHHFFAAKTLVQGDINDYRDEMFYCHGEKGLAAAEEFIGGRSAPLWESDSLNYPLNLKILDRSAGVIVHSEFAKNLLQKQASYVPIAVVPIPAPYITSIENVELEKEKAREELKIDSEEFVISSIGYANPTKRIDKIIEALGYLKKQKKVDRFKFYIVGEIAESYPILNFIKKYNLNDEVICTGYVKLEDFDKYIAASDMCINLRYPTQGESSASLLKIIGRGKLVVTTDIGSFSEFPNDIVYKTPFNFNEVECIAIHILEASQSNSEIKTKEILKYTEINHSMNVCAKGYFNFINSITSGKQINLNLGINGMIEEFMGVLRSELPDEKLDEVLNHHINEFVRIFGGHQK